jgi:hypothetical protein
MFSQTVKTISYLPVILGLVVSLEKSVDLISINLLLIRFTNGTRKSCGCQ